MTENGEDLKERIVKGIKFLRMYDQKADKNLYKRAVNKLCDLVEAELINKEAGEIFK